jgi:CoA-transferase family III
MSTTSQSHLSLSQLWQWSDLPTAALDHVLFLGLEPVAKSSFAVDAAAQSTIAASALAACELGFVRGVNRQSVTVDRKHAVAQCKTWFSLDGKVSELWDRFSGLYPAKDGWVRVHANFAHHRDGALRLLGLESANTSREQAERAMLNWRAVDFETAAAQHGLVATALRSFDEWDATEQGKAVAALPLFRMKKVGDAKPLPIPALKETQLALEGVRVLDLTRILAGPVAGADLACFGADVMLVNSPHLPNIEALAETSRGKRSVHVDLRNSTGQSDLRQLISGAHVFIQGYRPGGLASLGFAHEQLAAMRPGIVTVSLSAYGSEGPWRDRKGFDSLLQTAMGFNVAEAQAYGESKPRAMPLQIIDHATGHLMAFLVSVALCRQQTEGGSWHIEVSLAQTAHWLRMLGRDDPYAGLAQLDVTPYLQTTASGFGELKAVSPSAQLGRTPAHWRRLSVPPGFDAPRW